MKGASSGLPSCVKATPSSPHPHHFMGACLEPSDTQVNAIASSRNEGRSRQRRYQLESCEEVGRARRHAFW